MENCCGIELGEWLPQICIKHKGVANSALSLGQVIVLPLETFLPFY